MKIKSYFSGKIKQMKKYKKEEYHGVSLLASHRQSFLNLLVYEYNTVGFMYGVYMWRIDLPKGYDTSNLIEILNLCGIRFTIDRDYTGILDILYVFGNNKAFGILINGLRCGYYKQDIIFNRSLLEEFEMYAGIYWITHDGFDDFISLREINKLNPLDNTRTEIKMYNLTDNDSAINAFNKLAGIVVYNGNTREYDIEYFSDQKIKKSIVDNSTIVEEESDKFDPSIDEII